MQKGSTTPNSTDSVAKDMAAPDTIRGPAGTCSAESTDWGVDDEVLEEWRLKNELGRAERTHKSQTAPRPASGTPPPQIGEEIPPNWRNKLADRFFDKTASH